MQQGSEITHQHSHPPSEITTQLSIQRHQCVAIKEASSLIQTMRLMALYCIDQGHVTVDHMEIFANSLGVLGRHVDALDIDTASL